MLNVVIDKIGGTYQQSFYVYPNPGKTGIEIIIGERKAEERKKEEVDHS